MSPREPPRPCQAHDTAEAVARRSYGKLVAYLAARTRDVARAEDALADAFATALADWPANGTPHNPEAWLVTVARRKLIDQSRRRSTGEAIVAALQLMADDVAASAAEQNTVADERLLLMLACAHPAIEAGLRAPLILQTILGFDAATIASAFLVSPAAMAQRLVRAKAKIKNAGIAFRMPEPSDLAPRLDCVLQAIYAAYAEGWSDPGGTQPRLRNLAEDAIWLGHLVAQLLPSEPEALGLLALMLYSEARRDTRRGPDGAYIPLSEQNPARWNALHIAEAESLLARAGAMNRIGRYQLEAAIQSAHTNRRQTGQTDWPAIEHFYDALLVLTHSPVVAINRAIAHAETNGAAAGLAALDQLAEDPTLASYQPYWAARAQLLATSGAHTAAHAAYQQAIGLEPDPAVRRWLELRSGAGGKQGQGSALDPPRATGPLDPAI